ncbi:MAG: OB-fold domain-containing protein [Candidatus Gottesmanbacteria bacterium]
MISPVKIWRNQKHYAQMVGKTGSIISWTIIRVPPDGFSEQAPYPLAVVQLDDGLHITAQVVDLESKQLHTKQKVITIIRRTIDTTADGVIPYGIKVKPL